MAGKKLLTGGGPLKGGFGGYGSGGGGSTGANVGTGSGQVYRDTVGSTINFRTLLQGLGISIVTSGNEVTISSALYSDVYWLPPVISLFDNSSALPVAPSVGDRYIAQWTAHGWTVNHVYEWSGAIWTDTTPLEGMVVYIKTDDHLYLWNGTAWSGIFFRYDPNIELTAVGFNAGNLLMTGMYDVLFGRNAGKGLTSGQNDTIIGDGAAINLASGEGNTAVGSSALEGCVDGDFNSTVGNNSMVNVTGDRNTAIGESAGRTLWAGSNNIAIGYNVQLPLVNSDNQLNIGNILQGNVLQGLFFVQIRPQTSAPAHIAGSTEIFLISSTPGILYNQDDAAVTPLNHPLDILSFFDNSSGLPTVSIGDRYIATLTANGWIVNSMYTWNGSSWGETFPVAGMMVFDKESNLLYEFNGVLWQHVSGSKYWLDPVISVFDNTAALPAAPAVGDRYIAKVNAHGWALNYIYEWNGASWVETEPAWGMALFNSTLNRDFFYDGTSLNWYLGFTTNAAEIAALPTKAVPTSADLLMIEDAADANRKKQITIGDLPLLPPPAHAASHEPGGSDEIFPVFYKAVLSAFDNTAAVPAGPAVGDRYIAGFTAHGWTLNNIYEWDGASWTETTPDTGASVLVKGNQLIPSIVGGGVYTWSGIAWVFSKYAGTVLVDSTFDNTGSGALVDKINGGPGVYVHNDPTYSKLIFEANPDNVTLENTGLTAGDVLRVKDLGINDAKVATANKDGTAATPSMRTLGTGAAQACGGADTRLVTKVIQKFDNSAALPVAPSTNDCYIAASTANGWTVNYIYTWSGAAWVGVAPVKGQVVSLQYNDKYPLAAVTAVYDNTAGTPEAFGTPANDVRFIAGVTAHGWTVNHVYQWTGGIWVDTTPSQYSTTPVQMANISAWAAPVIDIFDNMGGLPGFPGVGDRHIAMYTANGWQAGFIYQWSGAVWVGTDFAANTGVLITLPLTIAVYYRTVAGWSNIQKSVLYEWNETTWSVTGSALLYEYNGAAWVAPYTLIFYGTGAAPAAAGLPDGTLFFKYTP